MIVKKILKYVIALVFTFWPVTADIIMNELDNMNISINTTITIIVDLIWPILLII